MKVVYYILFAIISTVINLSSQYLWFSFSPLFKGNDMISIPVGTFIGLICKYVLDKVLIFQYVAKDSASETKVFALYSLMGVFTTVIFWLTESLAIYVYPGDTFMKYLGAVLGLTIGYVTKYFLDKKYVFI